jgi:hypothetical protein
MRRFQGGGKSCPGKKNQYLVLWTSSFADPMALSAAVLPVSPTRRVPRAALMGSPFPEPERDLGAALKVHKHEI